MQREKAMIDIDSLGMLELLKSKDFHRNPPIPDIFKSKSRDKDNDNEDEDEDDEYSDADTNTNDELLYGNSFVETDPKVIADDIKNMEIICRLYFHQYSQWWKYFWWQTFPDLQYTVCTY